VICVCPANYGNCYSGNVIDARYTVYFRERIADFGSTLPAKGKTVSLWGNNEYYLPVYSNPENEQLISVTSSNQKLVSAYVERYDASYYRLVISVHSDILAPGKSGTAKITVKANDGGGTSYSFTVKATGAYG
jgi:hypothetical protein